MTVVPFAVGRGRLGGAAAVAGAWMLAPGLYFLVHFSHCEESHCLVTGAGSSLAGVLGLAASIPPLEILGRSAGW
jgi:hypothetical protein